MTIHTCYFCNYTTEFTTCLKNHIIKKKKCHYLIKPIIINSIEQYYELVR